MTVESCKFFKSMTKIRGSPLRGFLRKRCSENMQQIYRRTPVPKCNLNKVAKQIALRYGCYPVNLLHIFRTPFPKNTSEGLLLKNGSSNIQPVNPNKAVLFEGSFSLKGGQLDPPFIFQEELI